MTKYSSCIKCSVVECFCRDIEVVLEPYLLTNANAFEGAFEYSAFEYAFECSAFECAIKCLRDILNAFAVECVP